jgi:hypothetical protein
MKNILQRSTLLLLSLVLCATVATAAPPDKPEPTLVVTCLSTPVPGTSNCPVGGQISIDGEGYGHSVIVSLIDPNDVEFYNSRHVTTDGVVTSTNGLGTTEGVWTAQTVKGKRVLAFDRFEVGPEVVDEDAF